MKKHKLKSISFENDIETTPLIDKNSIIKNIDILFAFFAVIGSFCVFLTGFRIPFNQLIVIGAAVCSVIFFSLIYKVEKLMKFLLPASIIVYIIAVYLFFGIIKQGFTSVGNIVIEAMNKLLNNSLLTFYEISTYQYEFAISFFLAFVIFIISALICFSIIYRPKFILLLFLTAPFIVFEFIYGYIPMYSSLVMLFISWITVLGMETLYNKRNTKKSMLPFKRRGKKYILKVNQKNRAITAKVGATLGIIAGIYFILMIFIYPESSYERPERLDSLNSSIQSYIEDFTFNKLYNDLMGIGEGGINRGKLGNFNEIRFSNKTDLKVTTEWLNHTIFLRGYVGCKYTGNSFDELSDASLNALDGENNNNQLNSFGINGMVLMNLLSLNEDLDEEYRGNINITNIDANDSFVYNPYGIIPYGLSNRNAELQNKNDSYLYFNNKKNDYNFDYFVNYVTLDRAQKISQESKKQIDLNNTFIINGINSAEPYKNYNKLVQEFYTKLPEEGLDTIKKKYSGRYQESKDINACVEQTIQDITADTTYDLAPGKLPAGKDFVEYFLYENKKGYCTHYAAAATVILRAMGVPARYVEGYVIRKQDADNAVTSWHGQVEKQKMIRLNQQEAKDYYNMSEEEYNEQNKYGGVYKGEVNSKSCDMKTVELKDSNAHAWVEVYVDNVGWIPVDVTPNSDENKEAIANNTNKQKENTTQKDANNSTENNTVNTSQNTNTDSNEDLSNINSQEQVNGFEAGKVVKIVLVLIQLIVLMISIIIVRHIIIVNKRKKSFQNQNYNIAANNLYNYLVKIFRFIKIDNLDNLPIYEYIDLVEGNNKFITKGEFKEIIDIVYKANYSQHKISFAELEIINRFVNRFSEEVFASLNRIQKINYIFIRNLL